MMRRRRAQLERDQSGPSAQLAELLAERLAELEAGEVGSTATIARHPTVVSARAVIADAAGSLPLVALRDGEPVSPTPSILIRPDAADPLMTRRRWVHRAAMSLTGWGELYVGVLTMGANDWPLSATVLHPNYVSPEYDEAGQVVGWRYTGPGHIDFIVAVPLWELELTSPTRSPLGACQAVFDDLAYLWGFATRYWREGGLPPYYLRNPGRLDDVKAGEAMAGWLAARKARRAGMLTGNWELQPLPMPSAADALLLDGLAMIDAYVAQVFGIVPTVLNTEVRSGSLTYTNTQEEMARWLSLSLGPTWLSRIEDAFTLMLPRGQEAVFDTTRFGRWGMAGAVTDEARPAEGLPTPAPTAPEATP